MFRINGYIFNTRMRQFLLPADSLRHASALSVLLAAFFVALCSVMAIHAMVVGKTESPRLFPDFSNGVSVFDLFTTIPVIVTAFGCHVNGKNIIILM